MSKDYQEIRIVSRSVREVERDYKLFDVFVDGEKIPRVKRISLDFCNPNPDSNYVPVFDNSYTIEQYLKILEDYVYDND